MKRSLISKMMLMLALSIAVTCGVMYAIYSLYVQHENASLNQKKINAVQAELNALQGQIRTFFDYYDEASLESVFLQHRSLSSKLNALPSTVQTENNSLHSFNTQVGNLLAREQRFLVDQKLRPFALKDVQQRHFLLGARYNVLIQNMSEVLTTLNAKQLASKKEKTLSVFKLVAGTLIMFSLGLTATALVTLSSFSKGSVKFIEAMQKVKERDFEHRIDVEKLDHELQSLSITFNSMCEELEQSVYTKAELQQEVDKKTQQLIRLSELDPLTGLLNRRAFYLSLESVACRDDDDTTGLLLVFIDLDGFKAINDQFGHQAGDAVLIEISDRLKELSEEQDLLCRYGGDEFVFAKRIKEGQFQAHQMEKKIKEVITKPINAESQALFVSGSVGSAYYSSQKHSIKDIIAQADKAMYRDKKANKARIKN